MRRDLTEDQLRQEVTVALPLGVLLRISDEPKPAVALATAASGLPAIGAEYEGGIFAGVTLDGDQLAALVLLPGDFNGTWAEAKDWADKEDGVLPSRIDQIVLFKNLKAEFKDAYYWSGEQHADAACAWCRDFSDGTQYWFYVSFRSRARAVRRIPIR
jgi:hypothetical protein